MPNINELSPDPGVTVAFLNDAFGHITSPGLIEIAYSGSDGGAITRARLFENTPEGRRGATEHAAKVNASPGQNVYFAPSLRKPDADRGKRARKGDVLGAAMLWADFDAPGSQEAGRLAYNAKGAAPHLAVITGCARPEHYGRTVARELPEFADRRRARVQHARPPDRRAGRIRDASDRWRDPSNVRVLCHSCHSARTARDQAFGRGRR